VFAVMSTGAMLAAGSARAATILPPGSGQCRAAVPGVPRTSETCGAELIDGRAIPPPDAPPTVKAVIAAANQIDHRPYVWGGGHLSWRSRGYDCSGSVSYALHGGGLLETPLVSGQLTSWGEPGVGRWITIYAKYGHVYMVVAGLLYDTLYDRPGVTGPRWHREMIPSKGFVARHPGGL
jgi:hypothetical protein